MDCQGYPPHHISLQSKINHIISHTTQDSLVNDILRKLSLIKGYMKHHLEGLLVVRQFIQQLAAKKPIIVRHELSYSSVCAQYPDLCVCSLKA